MNSTRFTWVDWLLVTAIVGLSAYSLASPSRPVAQAQPPHPQPEIQAERHDVRVESVQTNDRPRPGKQVEQHCVIHIGRGADAVTMPANYLLYLPPDYTSRSKWPLLIYLHGVGSRGQDLNLVRREVLSRWSSKAGSLSFVLLAPQCPQGTSWNYQVEPFLGLIEHISSSLSIDRDRVYLTGCSMGGYGTWKFAYTDPDRFAAIAPLCGGGDYWKAARLASVPVWAFHGTNDTVVKFKEDQGLVDTVKQVGGQAKFTVYQGAGHGICGMTYQNEELYKWLLAQRRKGERHGDVDYRSCSCRQSFRRYAAAETRRLL